MRPREFPVTPLNSTPSTPLVMAKESERLYVFGELLKSAEGIKTGQTYSATEVREHMEKVLSEMEKESAGE